MKAHFVNEFEKSNNPKSSLGIGNESIYIKEMKFDKLVKRGINFDLAWDNEGMQKQEILKNIDKLTESINLIEMYVPVNKIRISHFEYFKVPCYKIYNYNRILMSCLTEDSAKSLINILNIITINNGANVPYTYEYTNSTLDFENIYYLRTNIKTWIKKYQNLEKKISQFNNIF